MLRVLTNFQLLYTLIYGKDVAVQLHLSNRIERMVRFGLILILSIDSVKYNSCYSEYFVLLKSRLCGRDAWVAIIRGR